MLMQHICVIHIKSVLQKHAEISEYRPTRLVAVQWNTVEHASVKKIRHPNTVHIGSQKETPTQTSQNWPRKKVVTASLMGLGSGVELGVEDDLGDLAVLDRRAVVVAGGVGELEGDAAAAVRLVHDPAHALGAVVRVHALPSIHVLAATPPNSTPFCTLRHAEAM